MTLSEPLSAGEGVVFCYLPHEKEETKDAPIQGDFGGPHRKKEETPPRVSHFATPCTHPSQEGGKQV